MLYLVAYEKYYTLSINFLNNVYYVVRDAWLKGVLYRQKQGAVFSPKVNFYHKSGPCVVSHTALVEF